MLTARVPARGARPASEPAGYRPIRGQARHELAEAPDGDPGAPLAYFHSDGQCLATRTRCLLDLDDPRAALAAAQQSLASTDPSFVRNVALTRLAVADAHAQTGALDAACEQISEAASLARHNSSPRLIRAIADSRSSLRPADGCESVAVLDEQLHSLGLSA
jgi:hypothetical protein